MARHKLLTAFLNDNIRCQLQYISDAKKVIHAVGVVFVNTDECCDEQTRLDLALANGNVLTQCADRIQESIDEIRQMILDAIEDKEQSATREREKAS